jgi:hypothetical protein
MKTAISKIFLPFWRFFFHLRFHLPAHLYPSLFPYFAPHLFKIVSILSQAFPNMCQVDQQAPLLSIFDGSPFH